MTRHDWTYALSVAATLTLTVGAICIVLFAMRGPVTPAAIAGKASGVMRISH